MVCCIGYNASGQETNIDSLISVWENAAYPDSGRSNAFYQIIYELKSADLDSALLLTRQLSSFGEKRNYIQAQGDALHLQGLIYKDKKEHERALAYLENSLTIRKKLNIQKDIAESYYSLGLVHRGMFHHTMALEYFERSLSIEYKRNDLEKVYKCLTKVGQSYQSLGEFNEALEAFNKALDLAESTENKKDIAWSFFDIGSVYLAQARYRDALQMIRQSMHLFEEINYKKALGQVYTQMARIHMNQELLDEGLKYHYKSLEVHKELNNLIGVFSNINNIGIYYRRKGDHHKAIEYFKKGLDTIESMKAYQMLGYRYNNIGNSYRSLGEYEMAHEYLLKALEIRKRIESKRGVCITLNNIGGLYLLKGQPDSSISYSLLALPMAIEMNSWYHFEAIYWNLYEAFKEKGNMSKALTYYQKYNDISDSVRSNELVVELKKLEFDKKAFQDSLSNEKEKIESRLSFQAELEKEKANRNILLLIGAVAILFVIGLLSRLRYVRRTQRTLEEKNLIIETEKEKAQASEKAKHQFLANMSHEIRTPMNAIKGMTDILLRREPGKEQIDYLNAIKESSNSLLAIINDILDISKIESGKVNLEIIPFSIDDVVQNVKMITQFKAEEKGLEVKLDIDADLPDTVKGDPTRLHQIILNLFGNAIKFTEKGMVTIQVRSGAKDDVGMVEPVFCISDTGVGIGEDRLDKIFESFEQAYSDTTRKFGGTGLGLSISKKLVEIQGGKIWVKSKKGQGSQFYFTIPFGVSDHKLETEVEDADKIQDNSILQGIKILLVEDNEFNAIVAREELEDAIEDVLVEVAENGVIAVEKVTYGDFDIILMDIQMPVMNGYEATRVIRNLSNGKSEVPIVAMTANVMQEEVEKCYSAGMNDFIGKPFDSDDLIFKLSQLAKKK